MKLVEKLQSIDRRMIYVLLIIVLSIPLLAPISIPLTISPQTRAVYNSIENLPPQSVVILSSDWEASVSAECAPQTEALIRHIFEKNLRLVIMGLWPQGNSATDSIANTIASEMGKTYGKDWCNLGYKPGGATVLSALAENMKSVFPQDTRGNKYDSLEVLKGVSSIKDVALICSVSWGDPGHITWVKMVQTPYKKDLVAAVTAVSAADAMPYVQSGQIKGLVSGLAGAAQYEQLLGYRGKATAGMGAQSMGHMLILALVVLGNIGYLCARRQKHGEV